MTHQYDLWLQPAGTYFDSMIPIQIFSSCFKIFSLLSWSGVKVMPAWPLNVWVTLIISSVIYVLVIHYNNTLLLFIISTFNYLIKSSIQDAKHLFFILLRSIVIVASVSSKYEAIPAVYLCCVRVNICKISSLVSLITPGLYPVWDRKSWERAGRVREREIMANCYPRYEKNPGTRLPGCHSLDYTQHVYYKGIV